MPNAKLANFLLRQLSAVGYYVVTNSVVQISDRVHVLIRVQSLPTRVGARARKLVELA